MSDNACNASIFSNFVPVRDDPVCLEALPSTHCRSNKSLDSPVLSVSSVSVHQSSLHEEFADGEVCG